MSDFMKIIDSKSTRDWDSKTVCKYKISTETLMDWACESFLSQFGNLPIWKQKHKILVVAGPGNNGMDAILIFLKLNKMLKTCNLYLTDNDVYTNYNKSYYDSLQNHPFVIHDLSEFKKSNFINQFDIIIDGLFGIGLSRPISGEFASIVHHINAAPASIVAIDMPSGLDDKSIQEGVCVKADFTITFQRPKLSQLLSENEKWIGQLIVTEIGLCKNYEQNISSNDYWIERSYAKKLLKKRLLHSHKGNYGHVFLVAGNKSSPGAAILAAKASLKTGCGKLSYYTQLEYAAAFIISVPEAQLHSYKQNRKSLIPIRKDFTYVLGPGLGTKKTIKSKVLKFLSSYHNPVVLDADALNILSKSRNWVQYISPKSIITPHVKEFDRLFGDHDSSLSRYDTMRNFSKKHGFIIVLKGRYTAISDAKGNIYYNSSGNPGMATAGSGDVLSGVIGSLLAQGYKPLNSAILGVFLHGFAGDFAAQEYGVESLMSTDIINSISQSYNLLKQ